MTASRGVPYRGRMTRACLLLTSFVIACGGGGGASSPDAPAAPTTIGASGGTVTGDGARLDVPAGALDHDVAITIRKSSTTVPGAVSAVYDFEPAGLVFAQPATVTLPITSATGDLRVYWSQTSGTGYDALATTVAASTASAPVVHFSTGYVAPAASSGSGCVTIDPTKFTRDVKTFTGVGTLSQNGMGNVCDNTNPDGGGVMGVDLPVVTIAMATATTASIGVTPAASFDSATCTGHWHLNGADWSVYVDDDIDFAIERRAGGDVIHVQAHQAANAACPTCSGSCTQNYDLVATP